MVLVFAFEITLHMSGTLISQCFLDCNHLVHIGWTDSEHLLAIGENGVVRLYDMWTKLAQTLLFIHNEDAAKPKIVDVCIWENAVACLKSSNELSICDDITSTSPMIHTMQTGLERPQWITAFAVVPARNTSSQRVEFLLATADRSIIVADCTGAEDQLLQDRFRSPLALMTLAPNCCFLACFLECGMLTVMSASLVARVLDFETYSTELPLQIAWCGEDSVLVHWKHSILLVGPYGHWLKLAYMDPLWVLPDDGCCRVLTSFSCELIQRVPTSITSVRRIGSTDAGAMLYDAMEAYDDGDAHADESLRVILNTQSIACAISANINAAMNELKPSQQQSFMRAASYGKAFSHHGAFHEIAFITAARLLRVLNQVRAPNPGIFLTWHQYASSSTALLLERLTTRHHFILACAICEYLGMDQGRVLNSWFCAQLLGGWMGILKEEELSTEVIEHINNGHGAFSLCAVTAIATHLGCQILRRNLVNLEVVDSEQVRMWLMSGNWKTAIKVALLSLHADTMHLPLWRGVYAHYAPGSCQQDEIQATPRNLLTSESHARRRRSQLHHFLTSAKVLCSPRTCHRSAYDAIADGYSKGTVRARMDEMKRAGNLFSLGVSRESPFEAKAVLGQVELLQRQAELELRLGVLCFLELSVSETIFNLIVLGASHAKEKVATEIASLQRSFKIPERRFTHVRINALAASGQWGTLHSLSLEKKLPVSHAHIQSILATHSRSNLEAQLQLQGN